MRKNGVVVFLTVLCLLCVSVAYAKEFSTAPTTKPDGGKWRIGYYEGGHYNDYVPVFKTTIDRLVQLGWLDGDVTACMEKAEKSQEQWTCLGRAKSDYLEFPLDAYWSADWKKGLRADNKAGFIKRANERKDLDLVVALGTWAGQDLASDEHSVPVIVCSTSNAVAAGIIKSPEDSGYAHVHARVDPTRYARQVKLFHDIVGFKKLGVVYEHSPEGRTYAGIDQIEQPAKELGFEIVDCDAPFSTVDLEDAQQGLLACHEKLAGQVDAFYITIHRGVNKQSINMLLEPLIKHKIPTFAMGTLFEVNCGAMMSMAQPNFSYAGDFYADTIAKVLNGASPGELTQILPDPQVIRVNVDTAKKIEFHLPIDVLSDAEEIIEQTVLCK